MAKILGRLSLLAVVVLVGAGLAAFGAQSTRAAATGLVSLQQTTRSYRIQLDVGPVERVMTLDQAKNATTGDVEVQTETSASSIREAILPASHSIGIYLHSMQTGAAMMNPAPVVMLHKQGSNRSYTLSDLTQIYDVSQGSQDMHFGQNLYLPAGTYDFTVWVGRDRTVFTDVTVSGDYVRGNEQG
jgi:hypothetical protein